MIRQFLVLLTCSWAFWGCGNGEKEIAENTKKVFKYNQHEGLTSLDPALAKNQANVWAVTQLYNGLFEFNEDLSVHPCLVKTWKVSDDGLTYTFEIRDDIYFHNNEVFPNGKGRQVTAEDFVYSFRRIVDKKTASSGSWVFNDKVLKDKNGNISESSFEATSRTQLKIRLRKPFPPFLQILSMPYTYVVPKEAIEFYGKDFGRNPVGTGPFTLKENDWDEGTSLTMRKNKNYWRRDNNYNQLPYLDIIQINFIADKTQEFLTFKQGKLDLVAGIDPNTVDQLLNKKGEIKDEILSKFNVQQVPYLNTEYIGFQLDPSRYNDPNHPFLNKKVRQAMSYAINREELVSFLRNNLGVPGNGGFVPTALPSFDSGTVKGYHFNEKKAKQLLKEAGFSEGKNFPEVTLYTNPVYAVMMEYLQRQWKAVLGIKIKVDVNNFTLHQEIVDNSKALLFRGSWLGDYPDEENYLSCFYSENFSPVGPNKTHFKNKKFDGLFEIVHQEKNKWKRHELFHQLDQMVMDECAVIVLFYDEVMRITQKDVAGLTANPMNIIHLEWVDFAEENIQPVAEK
ncbi:MAG: ABC transporter substrate-binding protein [Flammeovirgaceae bacterium]|nr:ABC transporter substrate-binding protein [Flammeovirgaceae bacterium]